MDTSALIEALKVLGRETEAELPRLNWGGCCVYAVEVGEQLQRLGIPAWCRVASSWGDGADVETVASEVEDKGNAFEWNDREVYFSHVVLQFELGGKVYTHDSRNTVEGSPESWDWKDMLPGKLELFIARLLADNPRNWNDSFDREDIPTIQDNVRKYLPLILSVIETSEAA